jgi:ATP-dependent DNA helicase RecG
MTATPIPRTLALMLYADLDISVLDEMPPGREPVLTRYVDSTKREAVYDFAEREMAAGKQVYVVASRVDDEADEENVFSGVPLLSAEGLAKELSARFPHRRIQALHGKMKAELKEEIMRSFAAGEIDLLASTVVIEVGVNIPNATLMIVENAERFGLAQLHQLRGRVGRGSAQSCCVLISDAKSELAVKRCETLARESDGFRIAELDLKLRGQGDIFGIRQHGLPELRIADPSRHMEILQKANGDAQALLKRDPALVLPAHAALRKIVEKRFDTD